MRSPPIHARAAAQRSPCPSLRSRFQSAPTHATMSLNAGFLYSAYKPQFWYYEIIEAFWKLLLCGVFGFIAPGTPTQPLLMLVACAMYMTFISYLQPYADAEDSLFAVLCLVQLFFGPVASCLPPFHMPVIFRASTDCQSLFLPLMLRSFRFVWWFQCCFSCCSVILV